ncbi:MAG: hypothetical protein AMJ53_13035 [Gammaproteobacteria bacterium SG8_11]|nr:MAG: hypothetical protein AMJ53_13035 [Gammaproteobacteria bacterium SG8_11]
MSVKISKLQEQIPLYISGALPNDERTEFEHALKQDSELKQELKEFHEIESVINIAEEITDQHFEQLFTRIQAHVKFQPSATQPVRVEEDSTVIMHREDGIDKASKSSPQTIPSAKSQTESPASTQKTVTHPKQKEEKEEHDEEEHVSIFSKEYISDFISSARLAWGVVIAQFALLIVLWLSSGANGITTIGTDGKPISDIATINVVFADNATQKEIRELLASVDAQIANGPTSIGLYTIYIKGNETDAKYVIDKLKKSTLILLAEPSFI